MFLSYSREVGESNSPKDAQEVPAHGPHVPSQEPPRANTDPRVHHQECHRTHWVPMLWSLILMNTRLSLLILSVGVSTESGLAVQDGAFLTLFSTLSMPHHQVCMYKCSFPDLLKKSSFFIVNFVALKVSIRAHV